MERSQRGMAFKKVFAEVLSGSAIACSSIKLGSLPV